MPIVNIEQQPDGSFTVTRVERQAEQAAQQIPGWATWDEQRALDWVENNVTDLASAKQAISALARMVIHLRDAQWPGLG